jgi:hypothetical protein
VGYAAVISNTQVNISGKPICDSTEQFCPELLVREGDYLKSKHCEHVDKPVRVKPDGKPTSCFCDSKKYFHSGLENSDLFFYNLIKHCRSGKSVDFHFNER